MKENEMKEMIKEYDRIKDRVDIHKSPEYKFNEDELITELKKYIDSTYEGHYGSNKIQATEFIIDSNHGKSFALGNVIKYAQRYGKKGTEEDARKDLMKILHYAMIALHCHDEETSEKEVPVYTVGCKKYKKFDTNLGDEIYYGA